MPITIASMGGPLQERNFAMFKLSRYIIANLSNEMKYNLFEDSGHSMQILF